MAFFYKSNNGRENQHYIKLRELRLKNGETVIFNSRGLIPVILQDGVNKTVLHLGYMDPVALQTSLARQVVYLYRRSSGQLEKYGENKNLEYEIKSIKLHLSKRALLVMIEPIESHIEETLFVSDI